MSTRTQHHDHAVRTPLGAFGIGLVHGMGGSAGVGVLILAAIPSTTVACVALVVLALFTAVSMTIVTTGFGVTLVLDAGRARPSTASHRCSASRASRSASGTRSLPGASSPTRCRLAAVETPLTLTDVEALAARAHGSGLGRVPRGGAGRERTLARERRGLRSLAAAPASALRDRRVSTATTVLGQAVALPVVVAPVAYQRHGARGRGGGHGAAPRRRRARPSASRRSPTASAGRGRCRRTGRRPLPPGLRLPRPRRHRRARSRRPSTPASRRSSSPSTCRSSGRATGSAGSTGRSRRTRFPRCGYALDAGVAGEGLDDARSGARLGVPRAAVSSVPVPVVVKGVLDPEDARARGRARRRRHRRLEPRRPSARRRDADDRGAARDRRGGRRPARGAARRRHPPRDRRRDALALGAQAVLAGRMPLWGLAAGGEEGRADGARAAARGARGRAAPHRLPLVRRRSRRRTPGSSARRSPASAARRISGP